VFRVLTDNTTECQCQMGCDCWTAPGGANPAAGSGGILPGLLGDDCLEKKDCLARVAMTTTLAKPDWQPPLKSVCSTFSRHMGLCKEFLRSGPPTATDAHDSADKCWDACETLAGGYFSSDQSAHKFGFSSDQSGDIPTQKCHCRVGCTCWEEYKPDPTVTADAQVFTFTLAHPAWKPPPTCPEDEVDSVSINGELCPSTDVKVETGLDALDCPGAPANEELENEGMMCMDTEEGKAYCSYGVGPNSCARCLIK